MADTRAQATQGTGDHTCPLNLTVLWPNYKCPPHGGNRKDKSKDEKS